MSNVSYKLIVEGGLKVLYKGTWVTEIPFDAEQISIGVLDPENNIYPDINLRQYRLEGEDPYISRRHARFLHSEDKYYLEDICRNNSTSVQTKAEILNAQKRELTPGVRIFISESVVFKFAPIDEPNPNAEVENVEPVANTNIQNLPANEPLNNEPQKEAEQTPTTPQDEEPTKTNPEKQESKEDVLTDVGNEVEDVLGGEPTNKPLIKPTFVLEIESQRPIFYKAKNIFTNLVELNPSEWKLDLDGKKSLHIGRHSTEDQIYPDVDLWKFFFNDGDEYIARKHARIIEEDNTLYFQDLSGKGSTWHTQKDDEHRLLHSEGDEAKIAISDGLKIFISDSVVLTVRQH